VNIELLDRILLAEIAKADSDQARAKTDIAALEARIAICQRQLEQNAQLIDAKQAEIEELKKLRSELTETDTKGETK
jgi:chromosome segregation ATPase